MPEEYANPATYAQVAQPVQEQEPQTHLPAQKRKRPGIGPAFWLLSWGIAFMLLPFYYTGIVRFGWSAIILGSIGFSFVLVGLLGFALTLP